MLRQLSQLTMGSRLRGNDCSDTNSVKSKNNVQAFR
jgi:hypothetical protein